MTTPKIKKETYKEKSLKLSWFTREQMWLLLTGEEERHYRTERVLKSMSDRGDLRVTQYGHHKAYLAPRFSRKPDYNGDENVKHGVGTSQVIISLLRCEKGADTIPMKYWIGKGIYPDRCILFENGWLLPIEYSTKDQCERLYVLKDKVRNYLKIVEDTWQILFVLNASEKRVEDIARKLTPSNDPLWKYRMFRFISYEGFRQIPYGYHLTTPCYLNGVTMEREALR